MGVLVDEGGRYGAAARALFTSLADPGAVFSVHSATAAAARSACASSVAAEKGEPPASAGEPEAATASQV